MRGLLGEHSRVFSGLATSVFARLHPGDLDFDGLESHFGVTAQLIFLSTLSRLGFQKPALIFRVDACLLLFRLTPRFELSAVGFFRSTQARFSVDAARIFHGPHAQQFFFGPREFVFGDLAPILFLGAFASFGGDSLLLVFRTLARTFGFRLASTFMFDT